jgi:AcrR family transcriptional regulator
VAREGPGSARKTPRQARARATVDAILMAAAHILKSDGPEQMTTNRIAELAGVSIGSLYQYFPNKQAVVAALRERHDDYYDAEVRDRIEQVAGRGLRPAVSEMLHRMVEVHAQDIALNSELRGELHPLDAEQEADFKRMLMDYLEENAADLRPIPDRELTAFIVMRALEFMIHGIALDEPERLQSPHYADELTELLVRFVGLKED